MKFQLLVSAGILLVAVLPCHRCRTLSRAPAAAAPPGLPPPPRPDFQPFFLRLGEEYFLRVGSLNKYYPAALLAGRLPDASPATFWRALQQLQFSQQPLEQSPAAPGVYAAHRETMERGKRGEEPPISLDLTFHLLREFLEMARAEQIAQQAHSNRKLMDIIGK
ncbi:corticoliberin [Rhinatrema bivittatum]|uniref:corticoliberin n=1 Tax=Rhinatrema bivittatum TaxID=194408 RepID=UPI00112B91B0|nr:corticoliberin [Rhinatrema bivittatum]